MSCALLGLGFSAPLFNSRIEIPKNEELLMRHNEDEGFKVSFANIGKAEVQIMVLKPGAKPTLLTLLKPGQETIAKVHDLCAVIVRNNTGKIAELSMQGEGSPETFDMVYQKPFSHGDTDGVE